MARKLTRAAIVAAALELLDEVGLEGLTLRAVAGRLSVQAPALYWHVRNKQDLMDEMATEVWRQIAADLATMPAEASWQEHVVAYAHRCRAALLGYRDGAKVFPGTYLTDPELLRLQEGFLARLAADGTDPTAVVRAFSMVHHFTVGFCVEEQAVAQAGDNRYSLAVRDERVDAARHPHVAETGREVFGDAERRFREQLALLVEAAERAIDP